MASVNNNKPSLHLTSRRLISAAPTKEIIEKALNNTPEIPTSDTLPLEVDSELVPWMELDQHLLLDIKNIKISTSKSEPFVKADNIPSSGGTNGGHGITDNSQSIIDSEIKTKSERYGYYNIFFDTSDIHPEGTSNDNSINDTLTPLQEFEKKIENNELDLINYSAEDYIRMYSELIRAELKEKYNYSDEYINLLLDFCINNAYTDGNIQELLSSIEANYKELLLEPELHSNGGIPGNDIFNGSFYAINMPWIIEQCTENCNENSLHTRFFAYIFNELLQEYGPQEITPIINLLAQSMDVSHTQDGYYIFKISDFTKLNTNGDNSWFDELYDKIKQLSSTINHIPQREVDNATLINPDILFNGSDNITAGYLLEHINELLLSDDPAIRRLAQILNDNKINSIFQRILKNNSDINDSRFSKEQILAGILYKLNQIVLGWSTDTSPTINQFLLNIANDDSFGEPLDIFEIIENIVSSNNLLDAIIVANIDGNIDEVDQGSTSDCWILSAIRSLVSTPTGKNIVKNAIQWSDNKDSVWVYFAGIQQYIQVTMDDIKNALNKNDGKAYSQGDLDVLIMELAMEKVMGGYEQIEGDSSRTFWYKFLGVKDIDWDMGMGLDDIINAAWGFLTGNGGRQDMSSDDIYEFISKLYNAQQQGKTVAATCWLYSFNDSYYTFTDIYGVQHTLHEDGSGGFLNTGNGHEFAIISITATTVTFANPHDSKNKQYTVTWEEFANLGFGGIECAVFTPLDNNEVLEIHKNDNIIYSIDKTGKITTNTSVMNYDVPLIKNISCNLDDFSSVSNMLGGIKIAIKDKLKAIKNAFVGQYDTEKLENAYNTLLNYYYNIILDAIFWCREHRDATMYPQANSNWSDGWCLTHISDFDNFINQSYSWQQINTNGGSGLFINEDNGRFDIYIDLQTMVNKFMELLS